MEQANLLLGHGLCHACVCVVEGHVHGVASDLLLDVPGGHAASQAATNPAPAAAPAQAAAAVLAARWRLLRCGFKRMQQAKTGVGKQHPAAASNLSRPSSASRRCGAIGAAVSCSVLTARRRQQQQDSMGTVPGGTHCVILGAALPTRLASSGSRRVERFASHAAAGPSTRFATRGAAPAASLVPAGVEKTQAVSAAAQGGEHPPICVQHAASTVCYCHCAGPAAHLLSLLMALTDSSAARSACTRPAPSPPPPDTCTPVNTATQAQAVSWEVPEQC